MSAQREDLPREGDNPQNVVHKCWSYAHVVLYNIYFWSNPTLPAPTLNPESENVMDLAAIARMAKRNVDSQQVARSTPAGPRIEEARPASQAKPVPMLSKANTPVAARATLIEITEEDPIPLIRKDKGKRKVETSDAPSDQHKKSRPDTSVQKEKQQHGDSEGSELIIQTGLRPDQPATQNATVLMQFARRIMPSADRKRFANKSDAKLCANKNWHVLSALFVSLEASARLYQSIQMLDALVQEREKDIQLLEDYKKEVDRVTGKNKRLRAEKEAAEEKAEEARRSEHVAMAKLKELRRDHAADLEKVQADAVDRYKESEELPGLGLRDRIAVSMIELNFK